MSGEQRNWMQSITRLEGAITISHGSAYFEMGIHDFNMPIQRNWYAQLENILCPCVISKRKFRFERGSRRSIRWLDQIDLRMSYVCPIPFEILLRTYLRLATIINGHWDRGETQYSTWNMQQPNIHRFPISRWTRSPIQRGMCFAPRNLSRDSSDNFL